MRVGGIKSVEDWTEQRLASPEQEGILPADSLGLELQHELSSECPVHRPTLQTLDLEPP